MRRRLTLFFLLSLLSCTHLPEVIGRLFDVYVLTDYPEVIKDTLSLILEEEILTPQPEKMFRLRYRPLSQFSIFSQFPNVFLIGTPSDTILKDFLGEKKEIVAKETFAFFTIKEEKRGKERHQFFIFIAQEKENLCQGLTKYRERIRYSLEGQIAERILYLTYTQGENTKVKEKLETNYHFSLKVPKGFQLSEKYASGNFLYLFTHYPDRSIFLYWLDKEKELDPFHLITLRDSLTYLYYDGDYVARKYTTYQPIKFFGVPAIKLQGVWQNDREIIGGPFVSYAFNYKGKFYFLDGTLFNPGKKKLNNLFQLSIILSTFQPEVKEKN